MLVIVTMVNTGVLFKCCKNRYFNYYVCVECYNVFHKCCVPKIKHITYVEGHKIICCKNNDKNDFSTGLCEITNKIDFYTQKVKELDEENTLKENYIQKIKNENKLFMQEAEMMEESLNKIINDQEVKINEFQCKIKELKSLNIKLISEKKQNKLEGSSVGTQVNMLNNSNACCSNKDNKNCNFFKNIANDSLKSETDDITFSDEWFQELFGYSPIYTRAGKKRVDKDPAVIDKLKFSTNSCGKIKTSTKKLNSVRNRNNLLILADSHGRDLVRLISNNNKFDNYKVTSSLKPNAGFKEVLSGYDNTIRNLKKTDVLVIIAGTNDVERKDVQEIIQVIKSSLLKCSRKPVILATIPYRYDKPFLNNKIAKINKTLSSISYNYPEVTVLDMNSNINKQHFTRYGLHLNLKGKKVMINRLQDLLEINSQNTAKKIPVLVTSRRSYLTSNKSHDLNYNQSERNNYSEIGEYNECDKKDFATSPKETDTSESHFRGPRLLNSRI